MQRKRRANVVGIRSRTRETQSQACERLYIEHHHALRRFLAVRCGLHSEIDDIVQEVFARLAQRVDLARRLPPADERNRSYLFVVANRVVINLERRRKLERRYIRKRADAALGGDKLTSPSAEHVVAVRDDLESVRRAILELKSNWRRAFVLHRFRHMSYIEIAQEMGVSVKTVEKYIHFALKALRRALLKTDAGGHR